MKDATRSDISALVTTIVSLAATSGLQLPSDALSILSSCAPLLDRSINRVLGLFEKKSFARMESMRLGVCYSEIAATVKRNQEKGLNVIMPDLQNSQNEYSKAEEVIEAVFKAAINDAQTVKSKLYGTLIGNLAYQSRYDDTQAYLLLKTVQQLSYYELCLIVALTKLPPKNYFLVEQNAHLSNSSEIAELYMALMHIKSLGLFKGVEPYTLGRNLDNLEFSFVGKDLCRLLELEKLERSDLDKIESLLRCHIRAVGLCL